jgi:hypothetical protein
MTNIEEQSFHHFRRDTTPSMQASQGHRAALHMSCLSEIAKALFVIGHHRSGLIYSHKSVYRLDTVEDQIAGIVRDLEPEAALPRRAGKDNLAALSGLLFHSKIA